MSQRLRPPLFENSGSTTGYQHTVEAGCSMGAQYADAVEVNSLVAKLSK